MGSRNARFRLPVFPLYFETWPAQSANRLRREERPAPILRPSDFAFAFEYGKTPAGCHNDARWSLAGIESKVIAMPSVFFQGATRVCAPAMMSMLFCASLFPQPSSSPAQIAQTIRIDASQAPLKPGPALYNPGASVSPTGQRLGLNSRYLTRNGEPWLPVMGEFHFSRYPRAEWEDELLKMKAAGVNIVATYVIWIHHEEIEGQFDWSGERDLRAFAQLCAKHGLLLEPRIGPWAHAEVRNGGLPDWGIKRGPTRRNDPAYLAETARWYQEIGRQLKGLMWKDGGPVVAIQLENEYAARGPGAGEEHILALKKLALQAGFDVPFYIVTGWDNAVIPEPEVIPVYGGGYPDAPWDGSTGKLPPPEVYAFRFHSRVAANMGAINAGGTGPVRPADNEPVPYLTAEIGGGIEDTYHRRPVIQPDDIGAMFPVMLGSGVNLYGTYMFHGGENPDGKLSTLEESQATGYPNDVPIKSYDFQAPIGEFGEERASLGKIKLYQYFLNAFGTRLAPMAVYAPEQQPRSTADFSVPRASVRTDGRSGFIFANNYVRNYTMPARPAAQFEVHLPGETLRIPARPTDIPSGAYFIWPFHFALGDVDLRYSTAQLFTQFAGPETTWYFSAVRGIEPEFAFSASGVRSVKASSGTVQTEDGLTYVRGIKPSPDAWIDLTTSKGSHLRLLVLSAEDAEHTWRVRLNGAERLLITEADVVPAADGSIRLRSRGNNRFAFTLLPAPHKALHSSIPLRQVSAADQGVSYAAEAQELNLAADVKLIQPSGEAPPVALGPRADWRPSGVAQAPPEGDLRQAGKWSIAVPSSGECGVSELFLQIRYTGDVARLSSGGRLLDDDFFNGLDWNVGLKRFFDLAKTNTLELSVLPLRQDAPVYFETPEKIEFGSSGQAVRLQSVKLVPEYELVLGSAAQ